MQKDSPENLLRLAEKHFQAKDYKECELALELILSDNSDHIGANELLAC